MGIPSNGGIPPTLLTKELGSSEYTRLFYFALPCGGISTLLAKGASTLSQ